jgi:hypothetical protein
MDRSSAIARTLSSRASTRPKRGGGQGGFVLLLVLGVVFFFSIVGVAIMDMTMTSARLVDPAHGLAAATQSTHDSDGALETAVEWFRGKGPIWATSQGRANDCAAEAAEIPDPGITPGHAYTFTCTHPSLTSPNPSPDFRVLDIVASQDGFEVARARVRYTDVANGLALDGYTVEVCDWQLGETVSEELHGCSS